MLDSANKKLLQRIVLTSLVVVTLIVAPYTLTDPMGLPKLSMLSFFAVVALSLVLPSIKSLFRSQFRPLVILLALFILQIILVFLFSGANLSSQFYGTYTRNTGALAYISLAVLLLCASLISDREFLKRFIRVALIVGLILIIYGNMQYLGRDLFLYKNAYSVNAPIGTFGNSNFQSAFMGLIATVALAMVLNTAFKAPVRIGLAAIGFAAIMVVYETRSSQGYLNALAGLVIVAILWLFIHGRTTLATVGAGLTVVGGGLVFLALFNLGPLARFIFEASVAARLYYWRAAAKMLIDHPFFGVGMDGFGTWYLRYRETAMNQGFSTYANSAHNVFADIATSGGVALVTIYCAIAVLVILSVVRVLRRKDGFDPYFLATVGAWFAWHVQSFVSINQLGLAIWGWVLSGLVIGYEINTRVKEREQGIPAKFKQAGKKATVLVQPLASKSVITLFAGVIIGAVVAIPNYYVHARFKAAIDSGDLKAVQSAVYIRPIDERRLAHGASIFIVNIKPRDVSSLSRAEALANKGDIYQEEAIAILRYGVARYPDSHDLWSIWAGISTASPSDIAAARAQMRRLDPFDPRWK